MKCYTVKYKWRLDIGAEGQTQGLVVANDTKEARSIVLSNPRNVAVISVRICKEAHYVKGATISSKNLPLEI